MKHILLVVSVLLLALVFIKLWKRAPLEGMGGIAKAWEDLWRKNTLTSTDVLNKFFESDMTTAKDIPTPPASNKMELTMKDIVVKASANSAIDGNGEPSPAQLTKIVKDGYRFIDLHLYMVSGQEGNTLYVGNPAENTSSTSTELPLSKALQIINENAFTKKGSMNIPYDYTQDPLFIQFSFYRAKDNAADPIDTLFYNYLNPKNNKGLIDRLYWHLTQSGAAVPINRHTMFRDIQRKALFGVNIQNLVQLYSSNGNANDVPVAQRRTLFRLANFKTGGHSWAAYPSYSGLPNVTTKPVEGKLHTDAKQMNIVLPAPTTANNPNVYDILLKHQIQTVPVLAHLQDEGVDLVSQMFDSASTSTLPLSTAIARAKTMTE